LTTVLKLGGELLEDADAMRRAASGIGDLLEQGPLVVVHGGGRAIDADLRARGKSPRFVDGLRITDGDTLETVVEVLAGRINTSFVAALTSQGVRAVGLTGADAGIGRSSQAPAFTSAAGTSVDLGLVGVPEPNAAATLVSDLASLGYVPVIASIGVGAQGALLNVNADVFAAHLARAIGADRLIVAGSTPGVFDAAGVPCPALDQAQAEAMVAAGTARDGMIAKLRAALDALAAGVTDVRIVDGRGAAYANAPGTTLRPDSQLPSPNAEGPTPNSQVSTPKAEGSTPKDYELTQ
jgi:acetylglutamate kinase